MAVAAGNLGFAPGPGVECDRPGLGRILHKGFAAQGVLLDFLGGEQARVHVGHDLGDPRLVVLGHAAEQEVSLQWTRELLPNELSDGLAGDTPDDLTQQESLCMDVIGGYRPGFPQRCLPSQRLAGGVVVENRAGPHLVGHNGQAGAMIQHITYR